MPICSSEEPAASCRDRVHIRMKCMVGAGRKTGLRNGMARGGENLQMTLGIQRQKKKSQSGAIGRQKQKALAMLQELPMS